MHASKIRHNADALAATKFPTDIIVENGT